MQSYPFTSKKVGYDEDGMPLYDRAVDSEFLRKVYACYFSDGVFYDQSDRLQVVADTGMQVKVSPGCVHIQGAIGIEPNQRTLVVQAADDQDRIDTVVARLDLSLDVRSIDLYIVKGTPAESPQAPAMTRDSTTWELGLANLFVAKNVSTISQQRITDTRLDTARCGQVGAPVQPPFDTEAYFTQLEAAIRAHQEDAEAQIEQLRKAIEAVEGDAAWMMKDLYDPAGLGKDVTTQVYTHSKSGTVHEFTGNGAVGRALMTADVEEGDTFAVNGKPVSAYVGAEDATGSMAGSSWNGKWVSFVFDGTAINFKGGGGLSAADKALLIPENIKAGVTFFEGTPRQVVGNVQALASNQFFAGYYGMWGVVDSTNYSPAFCRTEYGHVSGSSIVVNFTGTIQFNSYFSCSARSNSNSGTITVTRSGATIYSYRALGSGGVTGSRTYFDDRNIRVSVSAGQQLVFSCSGQNDGTVWCYLTRVG